MNASFITARDLANVLLPDKHSPRNGVKWCSSIYGNGTSRHVVYVIPEGHKRGKYYECDDRDYALLRSGLSPEDLEIEPLTEAECEAFDNGTFWEGW